MGLEHKSGIDLFRPDPEASPFRERFDIEQFRHIWEESGELSDEQAHRIASDLYEIDESYERMYYVLRGGIIPRMEAGNPRAALDALIQYQVWLEHLSWHSETLLKALNEWVYMPGGESEGDHSE